MKISLLLALLLGFLAFAQAGPEHIRAKFTCTKEKEREEMTDDKLGEGKKFNTDYIYKLEIKNDGSDPVENLEAVIAVVGEPYDWQRNTPLTVVKVLKKDKIRLEGYATQTIEFEPVTFVRSLSKKGTTSWKSGYEYSGHLARVIHMDQTLAEDAKGGKDVKDAIAAHKQAPDKGKK